MQRRPGVKETKWNVDFANCAGRAGSKFLVEFRDNARIMGLKCSKCNIVYVPPKSVCPKCYSQIDEWVEVSDKGTLKTYTTVNYIYSDLYQPWGIPYTIGLVQLDGADTGMCHFIDEVDPSKLKVGMRMQAVFKPKEEREALITDIKGFKPIS